MFTEKNIRKSLFPNILAQKFLFLIRTLLQPISIMLRKGTVILWAWSIESICCLYSLVDTCPFVGPLIPLFWTSGDASSGFQSQSGQFYSQLVEAYIMYVPWDSSLVRHLLTSWWPEGQPSCSHPQSMVEMSTYLLAIFPKKT